MGTLMEENETIIISFGCPECGELNFHDTLIEGDEDYDATEIPTGIALEVIGTHLECGLCGEHSIVAGTHPTLMTLNLYPVMKEE